MPSATRRALLTTTPVRASGGTAAAFVGLSKVAAAYAAYEPYTRDSNVARETDFATTEDDDWSLDDVDTAAFYTA